MEKQNYNHDLISYRPIEPNKFGICHLDDLRTRYICEALLHHIHRTGNTNASSLYNHIVNQSMKI